MIEQLPDGTLTWTMNYDDEEYMHRNRYYINQDSIDYYSALFKIDQSNYPNMPRFVEEGINAMSLFSNDQTVIDQASAVDRGTCNNEGLERKWGLTPKSIKTIEPRKEECRIYLKEFWGTGCFETTPEDFDTILNFVVSICPKASFGKIVKR